jgi:hypothetical protein
LDWTKVQFYTSLSVATKVCKDSTLIGRLYRKFCIHFVQCDDRRTVQSGYRISYTISYFE